MPKNTVITSGFVDKMEIIRPLLSNYAMFKFRNSRILDMLLQDHGRRFISGKIDT
jgi:hypothetical protein